jgi:hypothetical protein
MIMNGGLESYASIPNKARKTMDPRFVITSCNFITSTPTCMELEMKWLVFIELLFVLCMKLNGYRDNGKISCKERKLLFI